MWYRPRQWHQRTRWSGTRTEKKLKSLNTLCAQAATTQNNNWPKIAKNRAISSWTFVANIYISIALVYRLYYNLSLLRTAYRRKSICISISNRYSILPKISIFRYYRYLIQHWHRYDALCQGQDTQNIEWGQFCFELRKCQHKPNRSLSYDNIQCVRMQWRDV